MLQRGGLYAGRLRGSLTHVILVNSPSPVAAASRRSKRQLRHTPRLTSSAEREHHPRPVCALISAVELIVAAARMRTAEQLDEVAPSRHNQAPRSSKGAPGCSLAEPPFPRWADLDPPDSQTPMWSHLSEVPGSPSLGLRLQSGSPTLAKPSLILSASAGLVNGRRPTWQANEYFGLAFFSSAQTRRASSISPR